MKVVYVFLRRYCYDYDHNMFQFDAFLNKGWELECWSAVNWTFENIPQPLNMSKEPYCHYLNNENDLMNNLERVKNEKCYFLIYPYHSPKECSWLIRRRIKQYGFKFANITESPCVSRADKKIPMNFTFLYAVTEELKLMVKACLSFCKSVVLQRKYNPFKTVWSNFWNPLLKFSRSDLNFITTSIAFAFIPNPFETFSKRNVMIHSDSYDEYLIATRQPHIQEKPHVVFVDQFLTGHSDQIIHKTKFIVQDAKKYYTDLCILFSKIEKDFNCEVIIAAHPKAEYKGDEFEGRKIIRGKTNELLVNCLFALMQASTTFGLLAALKKPFINIYENEFFENRPDWIDVYEILKSIFHCKQLNIGDKTQVADYKSYITQYNEKTYSTYVNRYVIGKNSFGADKLFYENVESIIKNRLQ